MREMFRHLVAHVGCAVLTLAFALLGLVLMASVFWVIGLFVGGS
jgi:hypothetical protein